MSIYVKWKGRKFVGRTFEEVFKVMKLEVGRNGFYVNDLSRVELFTGVMTSDDLLVGDVVYKTGFAPAVNEAQKRSEEETVKHIAVKRTICGYEQTFIIPLHHLTPASLDEFEVTLTIGEEPFRPTGWYFIKKFANDEWQPAYWVEHGMDYSLGNAGCWNTINTNPLHRLGTFNIIEEEYG